MLPVISPILPLLTLISTMAMQSAEAAVKIQTAIPSVTATDETTWFSNAQKVPELFAQLTVRFPPGTDLTGAHTSESGKIVPQPDGSIKVKTSRLNETIQGISYHGSPQTVQLAYSPSGPQVSEWGCKKYDLILVPDGVIPPDAFVGIACVQKSPTEISFTISIPKEADWGNTALFEDAGKGERWHQYTIPKYERSVVEKQMGSFSFSLRNTPFTFKLVQKPDAKLLAAQKTTEQTAQKADEYKQQKTKLEKENQRLNRQIKILATQKEREEPVMKVRGGLGFSQLGMTTQVGSPASIQPILVFGAQTKSVLLGLHLGAQFKYSIPLGETSQSFYDICITVGPSFGGDSFRFEPVFGLVSMGQDFDPDAISFRHTNTAVGFKMGFGAGATSAIYLDALLSGYVPAGDSKYMSIGLGYQFGARERVSWSLGGYYQATTYDFISASFNQMMGLIFLHI